MKKRLFSLIFAFLLLFACSTTPSAFAISPIPVSSSNSQLKEFLILSEQQKPALDAHKTLYDSFLSSGNTTDAMYPANYGGDYIDGSMLHVCIVDLPSQDISSYKSILALYLDYVVFEDVDYSLQTLLDESSHIASSLISDGVSVVCTGVSEPNNSVLIRVDPENSQISTLSLEEFSNDDISDIFTDGIFQSSSINFSVPTLFEKGSAMIPTVELMGGSPLDGYTLGICGTYNNKPAIALCGHGLSNQQSVYYQVDGVRSSEIGKVSTSRYGDGLSGDYAIVPISDSSFTTTSLVGEPSVPSSQVEITGTVNRAATGLAIVKYGKNGGYAYGNVSSSNTSWYDSVNKITINGLVDVRLSMGRVASGDSGGPVYTAFGDFLGTVTGTAASDDYGFSHFVFSPYAYLSNAGFTALTK